MERPQHACNVPDRCLLDSPLRQRPGRLSFEIDDHVVFSRVEDLAEMEIAMNAGPLRRDFSREHRPEAAQHFRLKIQHLQCFVEHTAPECHQIPFQYLEHLARMIPHRLIQRSLIQQRKWFRHEIRIIRGRRQRDVQFRGSLPGQR